MLNSSAGCLSGKNGNLAAVAHAKSGGDAVLELKLDTLRDGEVDEAFAVLAYVPLYPLGELRKLCTFGLRNVEHIGRAKADEDGCVDSCRVFAALGFGVFLLAGADHRGEDADALLSFHNLAAKLVPRIQPCNAGRVWLLPCDLENVPESCSYGNGP